LKGHAFSRAAKLEKVRGGFSPWVRACTHPNLNPTTAQ